MSSRGTWPLLVWILFLSTGVWAQTSGSIRGEVKDSEGEPLPGATVIIKSAALIGGSRTTYTNELGVFRFPSVSIGTYTVEALLQSFDSLRLNGVLVKLDSTGYVELVLRSSTRAEKVTVFGETPLIDPTDAGFSSSYKNELLQEVPTQRNMWDLMQVSPGVTAPVGDGRPNMVAFGSNVQSNSWNIDGVDVTNPELGGAWYFVNPDIIEEVQVIGVGAPAEYGNHTGAVLNVVTKKGSSDFHGALNFFLQADKLTANNVELPDSPFGFHREKYHDLTVQLGGPVFKDRLWFFGAFQYLRDSSAVPGVDPDFPEFSKSDRYDSKLSGRLGERHEVTGFYHNELYGYTSPTQFVTPSAVAVNEGDNPSWGGSMTSTLSNDLLLEVNYSGWTSNDLSFSSTGSMEEPFTNTDDNPDTTSGGIAYPWDYEITRHQFKGKLTYYAENFLKSQHEFRFGVQYSHGIANTLTAPGPTGSYSYQYEGYIYRVSQAPYRYGGIADDLGIFLDDTVTVNDRLTLNLGVRFDRNVGSIPDYDRFAVGTPSVTSVGNWITTGEQIAGINHAIDWRLVSPRLGAVYQLESSGQSVLEGSFGVYYDHDVIGNWDAPAPENPPVSYYIRNPETGEFEFLEEQPTEVPRSNYNTNLRAPRTLQYAVGYERQFFIDTALGVQYVYKDTTNLIGWEILDGVYKPVNFVDPFTGRSYTLLSTVEDAVVRKGNHPGNFPGSEGLRFFQQYHGVLLTFEKRFSKNWALNASYTWSRSEGLIPRMLNQAQNFAFVFSREGSDPNNYINAVGRLQGDRPHMFRAQGVFFTLPGGMHGSASIEFSSGRAHSRQIVVRDLGQIRASTVIMEPIGSYRYSPIQNIDISIGKQFSVGNRMRLRADAAIFNLLNSDRELWFTTLELQDPSETFVPDTWVKPRRLQLRVGLEF